MATTEIDPEGDATVTTTAGSALAHASDGALARRSGLGDAEAFAELFSRHWFSTFRYAMRMLDHDEQAAQDAAQEAWIAAWRNLGGFRGQSSVRTWLFTITYRQVLKHRSSRRPHILDEDAVRDVLDDPGGPDGSSVGPERTVEGQEMQDALALALAELPWRQRGSWLLREIEGLSYDEIAEVLSTTPTVVRGQLHRARRALALRMEAWR